MSQAKDGESRPRVTGWFVDADDVAGQLLQAIGRAVIAVASLEKCMQLELSRLTLIRRASEPNPCGRPLRADLDAMDKLTGGQLLGELRKLGVPAELDERIGAVVARRNDVVHHPFEDAQFLSAIAPREGDHSGMIRRLERLALDASELAVELEMFAVPKLESLIGVPLAEAVDIIRRVDPAQIEDPRERRQIETLQAFGDLDELAGVLDDLIGHDTPATPEQPAP